MLRTHFDTGVLLASLRRNLDAMPPVFLVALSGGRDSTVLVHAMSRLRDRLDGAGVSACYVNHNLHQHAGQWREHCAHLCARLGVPLQTREIQLPAGNIEAAAREGRYRELQSVLPAGGVLLTAHQIQDQLETFLLQGLRGAGPAGLAGMPARQRFGAGWHVRPMLDVPREALADYATRCGLEWIDDPGNSDLRFDRNYLRADVLPLLEARWPAAARTVARSARHCAEAAQLLDELGGEDLQPLRINTAPTGCRGSDTLDASGLAALGVPRAKNALRVWLGCCGVPVPNSRRLEAGLHALIDARDDRQPAVTWRKAALRRYRRRIYLTEELPSLRATRRAVASGTALPVSMQGTFGTLEFVPDPTGGLDPGALRDGTLEIGYRTGGERIRPQAGGPRRTLKSLFQEAGVVPWMRGRIPLLFLNETLVAVADLWFDADRASSPGRAGMRLVWRGCPPIY